MRVVAPCYLSVYIALIIQLFFLCSLPVHLLCLPCCGAKTLVVLVNLLMYVLPVLVMHHHRRPVSSVLAAEGRVVCSEDLCGP